MNMTIHPSLASRPESVVAPIPADSGRDPIAGAGAIGPQTEDAERTSSEGTSPAVSIAVSVGGTRSLSGRCYWCGHADHNELCGAQTYFHRGPCECPGKQRAKLWSAEEQRLAERAVAR